MVERAGRIEIETALEAGKLWCLIGNSNYWKCRRNGKTKIKTRNQEFRIPIKAGLRATGSIDQTDTVFSVGVPVTIAVQNRCNFVICDINPLEQSKNERSKSIVDAAT